MGGWPSPSLLRNATAPSRGGLGKEVKLYEMPSDDAGEVGQINRYP